ncbi:MAG TPA: hypothetical protein VMF58_07770 [Rhizomicrobium sp.]|nr:hypothetical protein [Rhizomicrobium sp.]
MVAIEHTGVEFAPSRWDPRQRMVGLMAGVALGVLLAWVSFLAGGGDMDSARFASNVVLFSASIVFALYYCAGSIARLVRSGATRAWGEERFALAYGFIGMLGVYFACIMMPDYMMTGRIPFATAAYAVMTAGIATVFLFSAGNRRTDRSVTLRTFRSVSSGYFWMAFAFIDMDRMVGPHRPDANPYGISLLLLVFALLIRFADAFAQKHIAGMSERSI